MKGRHAKHPEAESGPESTADAAAPAQAEPASAQPQPVDAEPGKSQEDDLLLQAEAKVREAEDRLLRLRADFDNFRKRTLRDREETRRQANEALVEELIPVLDNLENAIASLQRGPEHAACSEGVQLVLGHLMSTMKKFGLETMEAAAGETFDPYRHEALSQVPSATVKDHGVLQQVRRGYRLGDKILRAVQVIVSSGVTQAEQVQDGAK